MLYGIVSKKINLFNQQLLPAPFKFPRFLKDNLYLLLVAGLFFTLSFISDNYWAANIDLGSETEKLNTRVANFEEQFTKLLSDTSKLPDLSNPKVDQSALQSLVAQPYFFFFYKTGRLGEHTLTTWNTQYVLPDSVILSTPENTGFARLENGYYVWKKSAVKNGIAVGLLPVKWNYIVTNDYLQNGFINGKRIDKRYTVAPGKASQGNVSSADGKVLLHLVQVNTAKHSSNNTASIICRLLGILFIFLFIHICASYFVVRTRFVVACGFLFATILVLRIISYILPFPMNFRQLGLFDPAVYGADFILRSLGDLLINAALVLWFVVFVRFQLHEKNIRFHFKTRYGKWITLGLGCLLMILATFTGAAIVRSLVADSQISFDVINFFSLSGYTIISFLILSCVATAYYFLCQIVLFVLKPHFQRPFIPLFLCVAIMGLLILSFRIGHISGGFQIYVLLWLLTFLFLLNSDYFYLIASRIVTSKLVFWIFFFSISISGVILSENNNKDIRNRQHYAEILATKSNPANETLLNTMLTDFRADFLADNFHRFANETSNHFFKDSLVSNNFSGYTDKYDTRIFSFDDKEQPLYNQDNNSYNELNTILNTQAKPTSIPGLFYYDQAYDKFTYIIKKTIVDTSRSLIGYVFILVSAKNTKSENLYPGLFSKGNDNAIENSSTYAFAIYNKGRLVSSHNDYPFATMFTEKYFAGKPYLMFPGKGYSEMWYNAGNDKYIVIAKENSISIESITLFSYSFCSFLLLTAMVWFINIIFRSRFNFKKLEDYWHLSIRNQIHGTIIFFSVVSFFVIGIATILFFINRYENNNREKLSSTIRIMEKEVKSSFSKEWFLSDTFRMTEQGNQKTIENNINRISEIHGVDVNLYSINGDLRVSSLPLPYIKGIVSTKMEPKAFFHLSAEKEVQYFQKENIGKLYFLSSYVPILDAEGNAYAFLNVPYFTSQSKLRDEISNFLVTIINLNAFIFLIAGIVALFITNRITNTFSLIGEKMKKINIGQRNEAIEWHRSDEIGDLVNEYNKMVDKLDESAQALAKTEREGAWREMARQVAHEIKNPLTPMKLSMQFLQKAIANNAPNVKELSNSVANTLVEQIDHLSNIANDFSQFANIGNAKLAAIDLNDSLRSIRQLYAGSENVTFGWEIQVQPVYIKADKTHINRLFTNLIQNGLQAVPETRRAHIIISETILEGSVLVKIRDNGNGIDEALQSKIFTPNFTTKSSGTGLGLAMCRRIVEQSNGEIYFETSPDEGTTFFISFPVEVA